MIDLNAMIMFAKVVEAQSYTQAARELGIPKSTISRKISQIEEQLGVRLLQRNSRSLSLTELGSRVYENCVTILHEMESVQATIENSRQQVSGALKVAVPISLNQDVIATLCAGFLKKHPKVDLDIQFSDGNVDLIRSGYDIAVMFGPLTSSDLVARLLFERAMILVASPAYLRTRGRPHAPQELSQHQGILLGSHSSAPIWPLGTGNQKSLVSFRAKVCANSSTTVKQMAVAGLGIAMMTEAQCRRELQNGTLVQVLKECPIEPLKAYGLYSSRYQLAPKITVFLDYFARHIDNHESQQPVQLTPVRAVPRP
ncbi:LysR family transcriptional regulator [Exilibacterium tricleocarpae]|uniref:LysR family transcriptional regulator n=1 Tax=Exilibacterium tricleocarpae TaxID=2591008 RepID=A0A545U5G5_9GAMM|nr:LysR family transcriptional regulator [Exilibacterium tricleocarpae]